MSVWNTFNPGIVKNLFKEKGKKTATKTKTIEEIVRTGASKSRLRKRQKAKSTIGFKSTSATNFDRNHNEAPDTKRSMPEFENEEVEDIDEL